MAPKAHGKSLTQPERAFWRDVFQGSHKAFLMRRGTARSPGKAAALAAAYADAAVDEYRTRILWRAP